MSISESSTVPLHRKRIISERVTENADPLVARKKAREAVKSGSMASSAKSIKKNQVRNFFEKILLLFLVIVCESSDVVILATQWKTGGGPPENTQSEKGELMTETITRKVNRHDV